MRLEEACLENSKFEERCVGSRRDLNGRPRGLFIDLEGSYSGFK